MSQTNIQGPIEVEIKVSITDGSVDGVMTLGLGRGRYPTIDEMKAAVAKGASELPEGFRLMDKREWFNSLIEPTYEEDEDGERQRITYAAPGGDDWDD